MKPVQCGGTDALFLQKSLQLPQPLSVINPCFAPEPLSPHLAFRRAGKKINLKKIQAALWSLQKSHDVILLEGAGGLLVPLRQDYLVADLARDLQSELVIVSALRLGTINHTLLTIKMAQAYGLKVKGVIFNTISSGPAGIPEKTNPEVIQRLGRVPILGIVPFLEQKGRVSIVKKCQKKIQLEEFLKPKKPDEHWMTWDKQYLWHPFTPMKDWLLSEPLVIESGQGNLLEDTEGRRYIDGVSSLWANLHGHRHPRINQAISTQLNRIAHSTLLGLTHPPAVELAKRLCEIAPKGLTKVFYSDNGSTAVEAAIKMAYQYWQNTGGRKKTTIAHLSNSYHGDTLGSVSVGGIDLFHRVYRNLMFKTIAVEFPDFYRCPLGKKYPDYTHECLDKLESLFKRRHDTMAALVIEPLVQGAAGMIVWPDGILRRIVGGCKKYDILFIADEVATGFGRTGKMFACNHEGVVPDFLCLAKGLTGGYLPLAATLTTQRIFEGFLFDYEDQKTFFHGHTYTGNPLACAAALANLEIFQKEKTLKKIQPKIKYLAKKLRTFYNLASVGDIRQKGWMVGIELVKDLKTKEPFAWEERIGVKVCMEARKHGVILRPLGNVIVLMPPLAINEEGIDKLLDVAYKAIERVTSNQEGKND